MHYRSLDIAGWVLLGSCISLVIILGGTTWHYRWSKTLFLMRFLLKCVPFPNVSIKSLLIISEEMVEADLDIENWEQSNSEDADICDLIQNTPGGELQAVKALKRK